MARYRMMGVAMGALLAALPALAQEVTPEAGVSVDPLPPRAIVLPAEGADSDRVRQAQENAARVFEAAPTMPDSAAPLVSAPVVQETPVLVVPAPTPAGSSVEIQKSAPPLKEGGEVIVKKEKKVKKEAWKAVTPNGLAEEALNTLLRAESGETISMDQALSQAYANNPTLRAARAAVKGVYEKKSQALSYFQPRVSGSVDVNANRVVTHPGGSEEGVESSAAVTLKQPLFRGGRTLAAVRGADAEADAQMAILATTERVILFKTAQAYMDALTAQAAARVNEKNRDDTARQLRATRDRFHVGELTRTDVAQAEFRLAQAQAEVTAAQGQVRTVRAVFEQMTGVLPERLALPVVHFDFPGTLDDASLMAQTYNPDVITAQALHRAAQQNINVEWGALLPEIDLNASVAATRDPAGGVYDDTNVSTVGVTLSVPLYQGGASASRVRQAKYATNQKFMNVLEAQRSARAEVVQAWESLSAARAELKSRQTQVRSAETARAGVYQEAEVGQRTVLDSLDADRDVRDAQIALISAKRNEVVAEYALASALGLLVPGQVGIKDQVFDPIEYGHRVGGIAFGTGAETEPEVGR